MPSRNQQKLLRKLTNRKHRWQQQLFVAEGRKVVKELLDAGLKAEFLLSDQPQLWPGAMEISSAELRELSQLEQADEVLGVFPFPAFAAGPAGFSLVLDGLKDPGNLGTIIRSSDWFGVKEVFCVNGTVDAYNAKCVQSSMGSIARVKITYGEPETIAASLSGHQLLVADMQGESLYELKPDTNTALIMGSESHGPSPFWKQRARAVTIPRKGGSSTESLNVAIATAIMLDRLSPG